MNRECFGAVSISQGNNFGEHTTKKDYDLALLTLSWETRATHAFISHHVRCKKLAPLWFEAPSEHVEQRKKSQFEELSKIYNDVSEIRLSLSTKVEENYRILEEFIKNEYFDAGRPLKVVIDISCIPKHYLLFILGYGFVNDYFACFDCVYSAGIYDLVADDRDENADSSNVHRSLISEGDWTPRQIPFLAAKNVFPKSRDILVSVGGELGLSVPFIERSEPRQLVLVFIAETAPGNEREMLNSERLAYEELISEPNVRREDVSLFDVIGLTTICEQLVMGSAADGVTLMAIGSKSHALALGLAAISNGKIDVVCRIPARYKLIDVPPKGEIYLYEIEDRFEPTNYLTAEVQT